MGVMASDSEPRKNFHLTPQSGPKPSWNHNDIHLTSCWNSVDSTLFQQEVRAGGQWRSHLRLFSYRRGTKN